MTTILLLGASGNIGSQTLDVISSNPNDFILVGISIGNHVEKLEQILIDFPSIKHVCLKNKKDFLYFKNKFQLLNFYYGEKGLNDISYSCSADFLVNALVGFSGFLPTINAIKSGKDICLSNKETLVVGGEIINNLLKEYNVNLYPIDSEHSAITKCLKNVNIEDVDEIILTASGGSFRNLKRDQLKNVTLKDALNHPTWNMGQKITIDSATMMNKGFEVIEAYYLFNFRVSKINILLDFNSYVHSLIKLKDGSYVLQIGETDMRNPIKHALYRCEHNDDVVYVKNKEELIKEYGLKEISYERYILLDIAKNGLKEKGNVPAILNAANEEAVYAFLDGKISFIDIEYYVILALQEIKHLQNIDVDTLVKTDAKTREFIKERILMR